MKRDFNKAKNIIKYLKARYGSIKGHTIQDDITLINSISVDHSLSDLEMMKNRVNVLIKAAKDTSYLNNYPMNLLIILVTTLTTSLLTMVTIGFQMVFLYTDLTIRIVEKQQGMETQSLETENVVTQNLDTLKKIFDLIEISDMMKIVNFAIILVFMILLIFIIFLKIRLKEKTNIKYMYMMLIEEAIEGKKEDSIKPKILLK